MSSGPDSADRQRWAELKSLFHDAAERPPEEWEALLADVRARDAELAAQLQRLLDGHGASLIEEPRLPEELQPGAALGPYVITGLIGEGGMGRVYRAKDARLGRDVAIKVLPSALADDRGRRVRMEREARAMGMLNHPNIVTVYDISDHHGAPFIVSELLEGETLRARVSGEDGGGARLDPGEAVDIVAAVGDALGAAHARGVVHRDIKPENVFLTRDGRVKVLDFGIAKLADKDGDGAADATATGAIIGTLGYITPEQLRGDAVGPATDVYACGVVLYELLAGVRPFAGQTQAALIAAIVHQPAPPLTGVVSVLGSVVARCLAKDPAARFGDGAILAAELRALRGAVAGADVDPRELPTRPWGDTPPAVEVHKSRPAWRRPLIASVIALVVVAAVVATVWQRRAGDEAPRSAPPAIVEPEPRTGPPTSSAPVRPESRPVAPTRSSSSRPTGTASRPTSRQAPDAPLEAAPPAASTGTATPPPLVDVPLDGVWRFTENVAAAAQGIDCTASGALQLKVDGGAVGGTLRLQQQCKDATAKSDFLEAVAPLTGGSVAGDAVSFVAQSVEDGVQTTCRYSGIVGSARATMAGKVSCELRSPGSTLTLTPRGSWRAERTVP